MWMFFAKCDVQQGEELTIDFKCEMSDTRLNTKFYCISNNFLEYIGPISNKNIRSEPKTNTQMNHQQSKG